MSSVKNKHNVKHLDDSNKRDHLNKQFNVDIIDVHV